MEKTIKLLAILLVITMISPIVTAQVSVKPSINLNEIYEESEEDEEIIDLATMIWLYFKLKDLDVDVTFDDIPTDEEPTGSNEIETTGTSGSGGNGGYCYTTWKCSEWSECIDGQMIRSCNKVNVNCRANTNKPLEEFSCPEFHETEQDEITLSESENLEGKSPTVNQFGILGFEDLKNPLVLVILLAVLIFVIVIAIGVIAIRK